MTKPEEVNEDTNNINQQMYEAIVTEITKHELRKTNGEFDYQCFVFLSQLPLVDRNNLIASIVDKKIKTRSEINSILKKIEKEERIKKEIGFYPHTSKEFSELYFQQNGFKVNARGRIEKDNITIDGIDYSREQLNDDQLWEDYRSANGKPKFDEFIINAMMIQIALDYKLDITPLGIKNSNLIFFRDKINEAKIKLFKKLNVVSYQHTENIDEEFNNLVSSIFTSKTDFTAAVLKKFIWQVKRKMLNQEKFQVENHLMPIIYGTQGSGKTKFLQVFLTPILETLETLSFTDLEDKHNYNIYDSYVGLFDEMEKVDRADINLIKNKITSAKIDHRHTGTSNRGTKENNLTFIGASNRDIEDMIIDTTGNRRFVQLDYKKNTEEYYDLVNNFNYLLLWQSVNPYGPDPMKDFYQELKIIQENTRTQSLLELFVEDFKDIVITQRYSDNNDWETLSSNGKIQLPQLFMIYKNYVKQMFPKNFDPYAKRTSFRKHFNNLITNDTYIMAGDTKVFTITKYKSGNTYIELTND